MRAVLMVIVAIAIIQDGHNYVFTDDGNGVMIFNQKVMAQKTVTVNLIVGKDTYHFPANVSDGSIIGSGIILIITDGNISGTILHGKSLFVVESLGKGKVKITRSR